MIDNTSGGDSAVLGLTRLSLRGFPLALVRQIPLSTPPLAIFIHKHLALRKTSNQENNEGSTSSLRNVNFCIDDANSHFLSPAYGGSGEWKQREATLWVCVCVCQGPLCSESSSWPGPLHMGFALMVFAERRRKWMLSELIGMTMGAYGCVCVGVCSWQPPYSSVQGCQVLHEQAHWESTNHTNCSRLTRGSLALSGAGSLPSLFLPPSAFF